MAGRQQLKEIEEERETERWEEAWLYIYMFLPNAEPARICARYYPKPPQKWAPFPCPAARSEQVLSSQVARGRARRSSCPESPVYPASLFCILPTFPQTKHLDGPASCCTVPGVGVSLWCCSCFVPVTSCQAALPHAGSCPSGWSGMCMGTWCNGTKRPWGIGKEGACIQHIDR